MEWKGIGPRTYLTTVSAVLKQHLYIAGTKYDALLEDYIKAASDLIEKYVGYPITYSSATIWNDSEGKILILPPNVNTVTSIEIWENDRWCDVDYEVNIDKKRRSTELSHADMIKGKYKVSVTMTLNSSPNIQQCCRLLVAESFENRENKEYKGGYDLMDRKLHMEESFV